MTTLFARLTFIALAACVASSSPALAQDVVTIGFTASKTGALGEESLAQVRGFELWRDEVNAAGGIKAGAKRYKVEFKSHDDELQVVRVQELYGRLIAQDKAQFLFGPVSSGLNAMAAFVSEENGKVMLSTAVDPKIFRLGNRNLFQVTSPASRSFAGALAIAEVAQSAGADRAGHQGRSVYPFGGAGDARSRQGRGADGGAG